MNKNKSLKLNKLEVVIINNLGLINHSILQQKNITAKILDVMIIKILNNSFKELSKEEKEEVKLICKKGIDKNVFNYLAKKLDNFSKIVEFSAEQICKDIKRTW